MKQALMLLGFLAIVTAVSPALDTQTGKSVRNVRYCEILLANGNLSQVTVEVYNTLGLNDCPDSHWQALEPSAVAKEFHARKAIMNGPRYFMMDTISERGSGQVQSFGGLQMRKVATFQMKPTGRKPSPPYTEQAIDRDTDYLFDKGKPVYELVAPDRHIYVMQSYSQIVDPSLSQDQLASLGNRLRLPKGWKFQARNLDSNLEMKSGGKAYVVQDDLKDTYQRIN
jgi:haloalkane dehalogenase